MEELRAATGANGVYLVQEVSHDFAQQIEALESEDSDLVVLHIQAPCV